MPGEPVSEPTPLIPAPAPSDPTGEPSRGAPPRRLPPLPLPYRPMTVVDVVDGAFVIMKTRTREVLVLSAVFVLPVAVLATVVFRSTLSGSTDFSGGPFDNLDMFSVGSTILWTTISSISLALLAASMTRMVVAWYEGRTVTMRALLAETMRRSPALILAVLAVHLAEAIGLLGAGVGAVVVMVLMQVATPVIIAESLGPLRAMRRSAQLTMSNFSSSLGTALLVALVSQALSFGLVLVPELATSLVSDDWDWLMRSSGGLLSDLIVMPFTAGAAALFYLDLRIRSEGIDLARQGDLAFNDA